MTTLLLGLNEVGPPHRGLNSVVSSDVLSEMFSKRAGDSVDCCWPQAALAGIKNRKAVNKYPVMLDFEIFCLSITCIKHHLFLSFLFLSVLEV